MSKSLRNWIIVLAIGFVIWVCPTPQGLTPNAWHLFAVFAATIAGFILQPISMGAVAFIALTFCAITGVLKTGQALMGFGNGTIWLIVCAFFPAHLSKLVSAVVLPSLLLNTSVVLR